MARTSSRERFIMVSPFLPRCIDLEKVVCLSVRPFVCLSNACIVTKRKKNLSRVLDHTKDHLT